MAAAPRAPLALGLLAAVASAETYSERVGKLLTPPLRRKLDDGFSEVPADGHSPNLGLEWQMQLGNYTPGVQPPRRATAPKPQPRCSRQGENCRPSGCCVDPGMRCFAKNEYFSGCRASCSPGEPEPGASGEHANETWTCRLTNPKCACDAKCRGADLCPDFPEVHYIYLPESEEDLRRSAEMSQEFKQYSCGEEALLRIPGVNPAHWPEGGGRYDEVEWFGRMLPRAPDSSGRPWWEAHNLAYAELDETGRSTWLQKGLKHHAGCSLSHFVSWMGARSRGLRHAIIAESDSLPSYWWRVYVGDEREFDSAVLALLEDAPDDWDVIFLDKGRFGVKPGAPALKSMTRPCWASPYSIYNWTGEGVAGLTLYMVSSRFLNKVPQLIHYHGLDMVDAWMNLRCSKEAEGGGQLRCFSVMSSARDMAPDTTTAAPAAAADAAAAAVAADAVPAEEAAALRKLSKPSEPEVDLTGLTW